MTKQQKIETMIGMNNIVKHLNCEDAYYSSWIWYIPDEADNDELTDIALDEEAFDEAVELFLSIMNRYGKYGIYTNHKLITREGIKEI